MLSLKIRFLLLGVFPLLALQAPVESEKSSKPRTRAPSKPLPLDLDVNSVSLKELMDMRPVDITRKGGTLFKKYFASHPQIRDIDLQAEEHAKTAQQLIKLSGEGTGHDRVSKNKLTASITNLLKETPFDDPARKAALKADWDNARFRASREVSATNYLRKKDPATWRRMRKEQYIRHKEQYGEALKTTRKRWREENPMMDRPLGFHLAKQGKLSAKDVELKVRELGQYYSTKNRLTKQMKKYLQEEEVPAEEIAVVMGIRQKRYKETMASKKPEKRGRTKKPASQSKKAAAKGSDNAFSCKGGERQTPGSHHSAVLPDRLRFPANPAEQDHASPIRLDEGFLVHPEDTTNWIWLNDFVHQP